MSGPSGVGKSSLLNRVEPGLGLRTSHIGEKTQKGRHTTTFATLYEAAGGWVADTPGVREFGIWDMSPVELGGYYVEFRPYIPDCKFPDCTHEHEPGCRVIEAVDEDDHRGALRELPRHPGDRSRGARDETRSAGGKRRRPDDPDEAVEEIE